MKVKLLKKLRKRFIWFYDESRASKAYNPWRVFDKVTEKEVFNLPLTGYYYSERTILMMLRIIYEQDLWQSRAQKFEKIRIQKHTQETIQLFKNKEQILTK